MELSPQEQDIYKSKVLHCVINCDRFFLIGESMIGNAIKKGLFENTHFGTEEVREAVIEQSKILIKEDI